MLESEDVKWYMKRDMNNFYVSKDFARKCAIIHVRRDKGEISCEEHDKQIKFIEDKYPEEAWRLRIP